MRDLEKTSPIPQLGGAPPTADDDVPARIGRYRVERVMGRGGFGLVYLAHDDQLQRPVAIKVPHPHLVALAGQADAYLQEARAAAGLDHPHVIPVYDVGATAEFACFVVSKFIDGTDLANHLKTSRLSQRAAVKLVATVAEALHAAHKRGLVHRDVKPGNILLDRDHKPYVADFGLALREQDLGKGPGFAGTPAYMSPEQARGEGHRVDGRSDVFSLGVVFYELLVGRRPFTGDSPSDLLERITSFEPRPPRQFDDSIPKELERICLKALAKRASDRYTTAKDMADDLNHFLAEQARGGGSTGSSPTATPAPVPAAPEGLPSPPTPPASDSRPLQIVPKGLRAFDAHDADFFLELLPGPRDRNGLPDVIRFWKTRLEETDPDRTFAVGLIYGPSGCGKSSLVQAGLVPRLSAGVIAVSAEATPDDTESRLLAGLRKRVPGLPTGLNLKDTFAALRQGQGVPAGKKVVVILDQFEQWLHARKDEPNAELVHALRQCDGGRVQCVVMVRDDFWMAATRFMREVEVRLVEGQNSAAVDLFPVPHAEKVLTAFGRAFGALPATPTRPAPPHAEFVTRAVAGLAQEGKVIGVRLALFADMMKGKAWTPATLKAAGGAEGVGVAFLEETFSAAAAPPEHRLHQRAARGVLRALLPETGSDIKGHMRSSAELLAASGYAHRPAEFEDVLRILDGGLRLITPTDPEGTGEPDGTGEPEVPRRKCYQLTHDYLVPALRDWLTRKQKETRRGRAELLLADRAAVWHARPEARQLPSLLQWLGIRWLTASRQWTPPQRAMMRAAGRHHALRVAIAVVGVAALGLAVWEGNGRLQARVLRDRLMESPTADAAPVVKDMAPYRRWVDPLLREAYTEAEAKGDPRRQLNASLGLLPADPGQVGYLFERLLTGTPQEVALIRAALADRKGELSDRLWATLADAKGDPNRRLRAACALAAFAPDDPRWEGVSGDVAAVLVGQKPFVIAAWAEALSGAARWLIPLLARFLVDDTRSVSERGLIASVYGTYAPDVPDAYARLERQLEEALGSDATADARLALAKRHADIGLALVVMGRRDAAWPLLRHRADPTARCLLIERLSASGVDANVLLTRFAEEPDVSAKRAILLSLNVDPGTTVDRRNHLPRLLEVYRDDPDAGVHAAAGWVLRQWGASDAVVAIDSALVTGKVEGKRQWFRTRDGQTMAVVPPGEVRMGEGDEQHRRRIARPFALSSTEVTVEQFLRFRPDHAYEKAYALTPDSPINGVSWYDAAAYCNWLSEREGIAKDQWCYLPNAEGKYAVGMSVAPDFLTRSGYRLPTEAEWEYACRAGAETDYSFGGAAELLARYGWYAPKSLGEGHPVGSLKPNDLGLFDLHGNVWEWCHDAFREYPKGAKEVVAPPEADPAVVTFDNRRVLRGGSFGVRPDALRSSARASNIPSDANNSYGFRPAKAVQP